MMLLSMTTGPMPNGPEGRGDSQVSRPERFAAFLADGMKEMLAGLNVAR